MRKSLLFTLMAQPQKVTSDGRESNFSLLEGNACKSANHYSGFRKAWSEPPCWWKLGPRKDENSGLPAWRPWRDGHWLNRFCFFQMQQSTQNMFQVNSLLPLRKRFFFRHFFDSDSLVFSFVIFSLENCNVNFSACFDLNLMSYSLEMRLKWWAP